MILDKLRFLTPILSVFILISCASSQQGTKDQIELFNGKDLDGWVIYGTEKWYVDSGELICESGPDKQYG